MLHLKDCVLAEVDKLFHPLSFSLADADVEESVLGLADLRLLPLFDVCLVDLKVDALNLVRRLDLNSSEEGLKEVEYRCSRLKELGEPTEEDN